MLLTCTTMLAVMHASYVLPHGAGLTAHTDRGRAVAPVAGLFDNVFKENSQQKQVKEQQFEEIKKMQERRRDPIEYELEKNRRRNVETANKAAMAGNLPAGWGSALDGDGNRYFYDKETKETTWEPPIEEMVALLEQKQRAELEEIYAEVEKEKL